MVAALTSDWAAYRDRSELARVQDRTDTNLHGSDGVENVRVENRGLDKPILELLGMSRDTEVELRVRAIAVPQRSHDQPQVVQRVPALLTDRGRVQPRRLRVAIQQPLDK